MDPAAALFAETRSQEETEALAHAFAGVLVAGDFIGLDGELGAGKTCFVRGLSRGLGVSEEVPINSPTFTLLHVYAASLRIHHLDFYRLEGLDDLEAIGYFDLDDGEGVTVVEWASRVPGAMPSTRLEIAIEGRGNRRMFRVNMVGVGVERQAEIRETLRPWEARSPAP